MIMNGEVIIMMGVRWWTNRRESPLCFVHFKFYICIIQQLPNMKPDGVVLSPSRLVSIVAVGYLFHRRLRQL